MTPIALTPPQSRHRILIVDDEPRNIRLIEGMLFAEPYELLAAKSGQEALALVESAAFDLILLDVMMPGLSGFEVCQQIKSHPHHRHIPVVMVTALSEVQHRVQAMEVGADDFLSKPVDANELIVRVRSLIRVRRLNQELERMTEERLRFMAGVAHDIRTPLSTLTLSLEMLEDYANEHDGIKRIYQRLTMCAEAIRMLALDVMNYYRTEIGQFKLNREACYLPDIVKQIEAIALPLAEEKDIHLTMVPVPEITIHADRNTLIQVALNLMTNAIKYTERGGAVMLQVYDLTEGRYHLPTHHYPTVLTLPSQGIIFEVADTGCGISAAHYERVFSEFDRLSAPERHDTDGIGLGLPVSQRLIRLHGGEIWFSSMLNEGSTFAFFIPLTEF